MYVTVALIPKTLPLNPFHIIIVKQQKQNIHNNILKCGLMMFVYRPSAIGMDGGEGTETFIAFLPFYHIYGMVVLLYWGLYRGHKLAVVPKFGVEDYLTAIQQYKVDISSYNLYY